MQLLSFPIPKKSPDVFSGKKGQPDHFGPILLDKANDLMTAVNESVRNLQFTSAGLIHQFNQYDSVSSARSIYGSTAIFQHLDGLYLAGMNPVDTGCGRAIDHK